MRVFSFLVLIFKLIDKYILKIATIAIIIFLFLILIWRVYPYDIVDFYPDHLTTNKKIYSIHESVFAVYHFRNHSGYAPTHVGRWFENSVTFAIPSEVIKVTDNKEKYTIKEFDLPDFFENGKYRICELISYKPNPIRIVEYSNCSNYFEIVRN